MKRFWLIPTLLMLNACIQNTSYFGPSPDITRNSSQDHKVTREEINQITEGLFPSVSPMPQEDMQKAYYNSYPAQLQTNNQIMQPAIMDMNGMMINGQMMGVQTQPTYMQNEQAGMQQMAIPVMGGYSYALVQDPNNPQVQSQAINPVAGQGAEVMATGNFVYLQHPIYPGLTAMCHEMDENCLKLYEQQGFVRTQAFIPPQEEQQPEQEVLDDEQEAPTEVVFPENERVYKNNIPRW